ncbi:hypothetical protein [Enterobacter phage 03_vB_Eclo_IJM]|nr:hypothetical protein [Enterobacter phage 03_vB_Eclo_IJM]
MVERVLMAYMETNSFRVPLFEALSNLSSQVTVCSTSASRTGSVQPDANVPSGILCGPA